MARGNFDIGGHIISSEAFKMQDISQHPVKGTKNCSDIMKPNGKFKTSKSQLKCPGFPDPNQFLHVTNA